jgi:hypothetical protein
MTQTATLRPERVTIPVSDLYPYEAAARLFGVIAYPDDRRARERFSDAICNVLLRYFAADPPRADTLQAARPWHLLADPRRADIECKKGWSIINDQRLEAAKMASPKWASFVSEQTGLIHPGLRVIGPTSNEMVAAVAVDLDERRGTDTEGNKGNIVSRVWTKSKPVIHLCLGLHKVVHDLAHDHRSLSIETLFHRDIIRAVIETAAPVFEAAEHVFGIPRGDMIEVVAA